MMKIKLQPHKTSPDMIELRTGVNDDLWAVVHVDMFWLDEGELFRPAYTALRAGKTIVLNCTPTLLEKVAL